MSVFRQETVSPPLKASSRAKMGCCPLVLTRTNGGKATRIPSRPANGGAFQVKAGVLKAYCEGSVGWVAARHMHKPPDGTEIEFRMTAVFHNENGQWKVVQQHASVGVPNEALQRYAVKATP